MAVIVFDLGCKTHRGRDSVQALIDKYHPCLLLGFDPLSRPMTYTVGETLVVVENAAAWSHNGVVAFHEDGWESRVGSGYGTTRCFDLAALLTALPAAVLKMDVEGAEYPLLEHLAEMDVWPETLLIEWHDGPRPVSCAVDAWWL